MSAAYDPAADRTCELCRAFFALFRCVAPAECACPKCRGSCECRLARLLAEVFQT